MIETHDVQSESDERSYVGNLSSIIFLGLPESLGRSLLTVRRGKLYQSVVKIPFISVKRSRKAPRRHVTAWPRKRLYAALYAGISENAALLDKLHLLSENVSAAP